MTLHAYGSDKQKKTKTLGLLALVALLITGGLRSLYIAIGLDQVFSSWLVNPITLTGVYTLVFTVYDRWGWKYLSGVADLSGTWVGVSFPNYRRKKWPHLEVMKVDQRWTQICIESNVFFKTANHEEYVRERWLGKSVSVAAGVTEGTSEGAKLLIAERHEGQAEGQPDFSAAKDLFFLVEDDVLRGKYFTNRVVNGHEDDSGQKVSANEGSLGPMRYRRVSKILLPESKIFKDHIGPELIAELSREVGFRPATAEVNDQPQKTGGLPPIAELQTP